MEDIFNEFFDREDIANDCEAFCQDNAYLNSDVVLFLKWMQIQNNQSYSLKELQEIRLLFWIIDFVLDPYYLYNYLFHLYICLV